MGCVYQIRNIFNNKIYIGSTNDFTHRKGEHLYDLRKGKHSNSHLQNSYNKYGESNFVFTVLEDYIDTTALEEREQYWFDSYKNQNYILYNARPIAVNSNKGIKHSKLFREKCRKRARGNKNSLGKTHSENTKRQMSIKAQARKHKMYRSIIQQDTFTGEVIKIWDSILAASQSLNIGKSNISTVLSGRTKTAGGYKWSYNDQ